MLLSNQLKCIGVISVVFLGVVIFIGNVKLYKAIRKYEPEFFAVNSGGFFTRMQKFPWIILLGRYKRIKDRRLRRFCSIQRLLSILFELFFIMIMLLIIIF